MVGVIGPDGVGKSTLLGLIAGVKVIQSGEVVVFDKTIANKETLRDIRGRIAYMPQGLGRNLYPTLSVFENIDFFGRLFGLSATERRAKIDELLTATSLEKFEARPAGKLSGGMKQKLSLCCALINDPDLLILDEPTTGVDPLSRGQFWDLINTIRARRPQMSVIVATAYMDEAERFDWLMAMDDGKIIATGTLKELLAKTGEPNLDDAFIAMMPEAKRALHKKVVVRPRVASPDETPAIEAEGLTRQFGDFVAVDHVSFRIPRGEIFGFLGSNGCGKSTTMKMLVGFLPATSGTCKLFGEPMGSNDMQARRNVGYMTQAFSLYGELTVAQNLRLHAELYHLPKEKIGPRIEELLDRYDLMSVVNSRPDSLPLGMKQRLQLAVAVLHEPSFLSVNAMVPSIFMLLLCLIPAIMSAIAVVREKETGSIANFRSTPITQLEYLIGKQLPYIAVAMIAFFALLLIAIFIFHVPPKGPFLVLLLGTIVYVIATVGFGVLISSFTRTQVAAVFATAILSIVPAFNFSGMLAPVSSLSGGARIIGLSFPSSWYQQVSVGVFAKALGIVDLWRDIAAIAVIALVFLGISLALLRKQEA